MKLLIIASVLVVGCGYTFGPLRRSVRVDVENRTLYRGISVKLRRALITTLTQRGISTESGETAFVSIISVKGTPFFEVARKVLYGEIVVTATVTLTNKKKLFTLRVPYSTGGAENAVKIAVSELAETIADWLASQH